jgi:hypothetical protein
LLHLRTTFQIYCFYPRTWGACEAR